MKRKVCLFVAPVVVLLPIWFAAKPTGSQANGSRQAFPQVELSTGVDTAWVRYYASGLMPGTDRAVDLAIDKFGNVYVTGYSTSPSRGCDFYTIKYSSDGGEVWSARYDGNGGDDMPATIRVDASGNVYVTGISSNDHATIKYNALGVELWVIRYHGSEDDFQMASDLEVDQIGNVYVTASSVTIKYDTSGNEQWTVPFEWGVSTDLAIDDSGNVYVTGRTNYLDITKSDYVTIKYNAVGLVQWQTNYNGPANANDEATALAVDRYGNIYVTGYSDGSGTHLDFATVKYNACGVEQWVARYNSTANGYDRAYAIAVDDSGDVYVMGHSDPETYTTIKYGTCGARKWLAHTDGSTGGPFLFYIAPALAVDKFKNVYLAGEFNGYGITVKYDASGVQQWWRAQLNQYGYASALAVDDSGNVYVAGATGIHYYYISGSCYGDYATIKRDASGAEQWAALYDGPGSSNDGTCDIAIDKSGNIYVTGTSEYLWDWNSIGDYVTVKYDATGAQQWVAIYDGRGATFDRAVANAVDDAGNVYVTGTSAEDYLTIKYDASGAVQWLSRYNGPGNARDEAVDIAIDGEGNVYVTGWGWSEGSGTGGDLATIKYNASGVEQWVARYNGSDNQWEEAKDMAVDSAGNVYVTGYGGGGLHEAAHAYITLKYNTSGQLQWVARYKGPSNKGDYPSSLDIDDSGNVYVTGSSYGSTGNPDYATIKYDAAGTEQWVARYNGPGNSSDNANSLAVDRAGNVYVTGESDTADYVTVKYNAAGLKQWVCRYNGPANEDDVARALAVDALGNVYVTGSCVGSGYNDDFATIKYDSSGIEQWVARYNGPGNGQDGAVALSLDGAGNLYIVGASGGSGWSMMTTIKYTETGTPVVIHHEPAFLPKDFNLKQNYPNPFNPSTTIEFALPKSAFVTLKVYNLLGEEVATLVTEQRAAGIHKFNWDASGLASGVYFYRLEAGDPSTGFPNKSGQAGQGFVQTKKLILMR